MVTMAEVLAYERQAAIANARGAAGLPFPKTPNSQGGFLSPRDVYMYERFGRPATTSPAKIAAYHAEPLVVEQERQAKIAQAAGVSMPIYAQGAAAPGIQTLQKAATRTLEIKKQQEAGLDTAGELKAQKIRLIYMILMLVLLRRWGY